MSFFLLKRPKKDENIFWFWIKTFRLDCTVPYKKLLLILIPKQHYKQIVSLIMLFCDILPLFRINVQFPNMGSKIKRRCPDGKIPYFILRSNTASVPFIYLHLDWFHCLKTGQNVRYNCNWGSLLYLIIHASNCYRKNDGLVLD